MCCSVYKGHNTFVATDLLLKWIINAALIVFTIRQSLSISIFYSVLETSCGQVAKLALTRIILALSDDSLISMTNSFVPIVTVRKVIDIKFTWTIHTTFE